MSSAFYNSPERAGRKTIAAFYAMSLVELPANGYLTSFYSGNVDEGRLQEMLDYVEEYDIDVRPERVFTLGQIPEAHAYLDSSKSFGKVVAVDTILI